MDELPSRNPRRILEEQAKKASQRKVQPLPVLTPAQQVHQEVTDFFETMPHFRFWKDLNELSSKRETWAAIMRMSGDIPSEEAWVEYQESSGVNTLTEAQRDLLRQRSVKAEPTNYAEIEITQDHIKEFLQILNPEVNTLYDEYVAAHPKEIFGLIESKSEFDFKNFRDENEKARKMKEVLLDPTLFQLKISGNT